MSTTSIPHQSTGPFSVPVPSVKSEALQLAARTFGDAYTPEEVVAAAAEFEAYLSGGEA